jgi:transcription factor E
LSSKTVRKGKRKKVKRKKSIVKKAKKAAPRVRKTSKKARKRVPKVKKAVSRKKKARKPVKRKALKRGKKVIRKKAKKVAKKAPRKAKPKFPKPKKKEPVRRAVLTEKERMARKQVTTILGDAAVRQMLIDIGGENALAIIRNFYSNHSDEELAKKLKIKISDVRATLNKLHNEGLVNYMREKDSETGWYSYSWSLNQERMQKWADTTTDKLHSICDGNGGEYYFCPSCGMSSIIDFESASNWEFRCERCNRMLEFIDETKMSELMENMRA